MPRPKQAAVAETQAAKDKRLNEAQKRTFRPQGGNPRLSLAEQRLIKLASKNNPHKITRRVREATNTAIRKRKTD